MNKKIGSRYLPYCFLTPAIVFLLLFMAYPILNVFYYSLQNYATNKPYLRGFVGLDNMMKILTGIRYSGPVFLFQLNGWLSRWGFSWYSGL